MTNTNEKRNAAILRAVLSPTHKLAEDAQRDVEPYLKRAATTHDRIAGRISAAKCLQSPTGAHHFDMSWPEGRYIGTCRYCNEVREYDPMAAETVEALRSGAFTAREDGLQRDWVENE
jgi:uncharacterized protein (DUF849 family)